MEGLWALTKGLMTSSLDQCVGTPGFPIRASLTPRSDQSLKNKELALHQDLTPPPPFPCASTSCSCLSLCGHLKPASRMPLLALGECGGLMTILGLAWVGTYRSLSLRLQGYRSRWSWWGWGGNAGSRWQEGNLGTKLKSSI